MRPTCGVRFPGEAAPRDVPQWRTRARWLHLDCNPLEGYAGLASFEDDGSAINFSRTLIIQGL